MPLSISMEDACHFTKQLQQDFEQFPEVRGVIS